jgi:hypothetical protein
MVREEIIESRDKKQNVPKVLRMFPAAPASGPRWHGVDCKLRILNSQDAGVGVEFFAKIGEISVDRDKFELELA